MAKNSARPARQPLTTDPAARGERSHPFLEFYTVQTANTERAQAKRVIKFNNNKKNPTTNQKKNPTQLQVKFKLRKFQVHRKALTLQ